MAPRLKTYTAEIDGLHEWIVAAPNQTAALAAFGISRNLFAADMAGVTEAKDAVDAASAKPGQVLRRMRGSKGKFEPPKAETSGWDAALAATPKRPKTKPDRSKIEKAERALEAFEGEAADSLNQIDRERADLVERAKAVKADIASRRKSLRKAVSDAKAAYAEA